MFPSPLDIPDNLIRVEIPFHEEAIASSATGSLLRSPPEEGPWKYEDFAVVDSDPVGTWNDARLGDVLNVRPWREKGVLGKGVKLAVFDIEWFGTDFTEELHGMESHDCFVHPSCSMPIDPNGVHFANEEGKHGIACAQVVLDIAPEVEMHLVRVGSRTTFENAVDWAIREEIDVITMSLSFFNESFYDGTGPISQDVERLNAAGILLITSAGNNARNHVRDAFRDEDQDGWHEFDHGSEYLPIYYPAGIHRINFLWDDFGRCGTNDFDLFLWSPSDLLVGRGLDEQNIGARQCFSGERVVVTTEEEGWHYLQIRRNKGGLQSTLDILARGGHVYYNEPDDSLSDPAVSPFAFTIGAANMEGFFSGSVEPFTSQSLAKPNIIGPDGLSTPVYGGWGFFGTSAATPAVAGLVAILHSAYPDKSVFWAAQTLQNHAVFPLQPVEGVQLGAGYARLPDPEERLGCMERGMLLPILLLGWRKRDRQRNKK